MVKRKQITKSKEVNTSKKGRDPATKKIKIQPKSETKQQIDSNRKGERGKFWIGAHVGGGVANSVSNAAELNASSFALFVSNPRAMKKSEISDAKVKTFQMQMKNHGYSHEHVLPHGGYLINLGNPDKEKYALAKSLFIHEMSLCEKLGLSLYNFHPGSSVGQCETDQSIEQIANAINECHGKTKNVIAVLENTAGGGNTIGRSFDELKQIIAKVKDKSRVGVCLDTCHAFASGYNIQDSKSFDKVMKEFDDIVGLEYLKSMHLNDSEGALSSHKDRHANLGKGKIGLKCFEFIVNDERFTNMPLILETPNGDEMWKKELELLRGYMKT